MPTPDQFQAAIQNPSSCFANPDLRECAVEKDNWGLPRVRSGGFAYTYKLIGRNGTWAVRCFKNDNREREERYRAISKFINQNPSEVLVKTSYQPKGIRIGDQWHPITYMDWVEGETLQSFLDKNYKNPTLIQSLIEKFLNVTNEINRLKISHGDISSANIMVKNGKMVLVDYDGMYVPELIGLRSTELGNINFQHPDRNEKDFNPNIDRFSTIVVYLSLLAIKSKPDLWLNYGTGEGLIFSRKDFIKPNQSQVINELKKIPKIRQYVDFFVDICLADISQIPNLESFINKPTLKLKPQERTHYPQVYTQYPVIRGTQIQELLQKDGDRITVIGEIVEIYEGIAYYGPKPGSSYMFFNFSRYPYERFYCVAWQEVLDLFESLNLNPLSLHHKWVSVTGLISVYKGKPQIILESPKDITILSGVKEARAILNPRQRESQVVQSGKKDKKPYTQSIPKNTTVPKIQSNQPYIQKPAYTQTITEIKTPTVATTTSVSTQSTQVGSTTSNKPTKPIPPYDLVIKNPPDQSISIPQHQLSSNTSSKKKTIFKNNIYKTTAIVLFFLFLIMWSCIFIIILQS